MKKRSAQIQQYDHSMLTAINTAKAIKDNITDKTNIWNVNTEKEYHESK